jgi:hypothetical protein
MLSIVPSTLVSKVAAYVSAVCSVHWTRPALGPGVVDGNVQPTKPLHRLIDEAPDVVFVPHVGLHELGFGTEFVQFGDERLASIFVATGDDDAGAVLRKG